MITQTMKLTTSVYKYSRFAPWMIVLIALGTVLFFLFSSALHPIMNVIGIIIIAFFAVFAALRPKSIFSIRAVDDRKLVLTPDELIWGTWKIPIHELEKIEVYIHAFDTFKYPTGRISGQVVFTREYGDRNTISFSYRDTKYDLTFFLGNFVHYDTLISIMRSWREQGLLFSARSAFTDSYIRQQVNLYG